METRPGHGFRIHPRRTTGATRGAVASVRAVSARPRLSIWGQLVKTQKFETVVKKGGGGRGESLVNSGSKQAGKRVRGSWNVKFKFVTPHFIFACLIASAQNRRLRIVVETEVNFRRDAETRMSTTDVAKPK